MLTLRFDDSTSVDQTPYPSPRRECFSHISKWIGHNHTTHLISITMKQKKIPPFLFCPTKMHLIKLNIVRNEFVARYEKRKTSHYFEKFKKFNSQMATAAATATVKCIYVCGYHTPLRVVQSWYQFLRYWAIKRTCKHILSIHSHMEMIAFWFLLFQFLFAVG